VEPTFSFGRRATPVPGSPRVAQPRAASPDKPRQGGVYIGSGPRGGDAPYRAERPAPAPAFSAEVSTWSMPWVSLGLLAVMALVFWIEAGGLGATLDLSPSVTRLRALGGLSGATVLQHGEWWRVLTAPLMHANLDHIMGNAFVLLLCGALLEGLIGRAWYGALFVVGAIGGSLASLAMNSPHIVGIGASGAIMALLAAVFMCSLHPEAVFHAKRMRWLSLRIAIPALIPFAAAGGASVDYSCHLGGAIAGLGMGFVLLAIWREGSPRPGHARVALGIDLAGAALAVVAFALVGLNAARWSIVNPRLAPDAEFKGSNKEIMARTPLLVLRYPADPRVRFFHALELEDQQDPEGMEADLRAALADPKLMEETLPVQAPPAATLMLAYAVAQQRRMDEARTIAGPACGYGFTDRGMKGMVRAMRREGLCPGG
jgi:rhomboid protease GluP